MKAETFARFFGTPMFLVAQTLIVAAWIVLNVAGVTRFDLYPFILLNLAFSTQAAYAAPLILLAQTRQADRDKAHTEADIQHREALAAAAGRPRGVRERSHPTSTCSGGCSSYACAKMNWSSRLRGLTYACFSEPHLVRWFWGRSAVHAAHFTEAYQSRPYTHYPHGF
jgi:hypothetical protein